MSANIEQWKIKAYEKNVYHLLQQMESRTMVAAMIRDQQAELKFYDRLGSTEAIQKVGRHSDTPQIDSDHSRRGCILTDWEWADLIDDEDQIRILNKPESHYVRAAVMAFNRRRDHIFLDAATGDALTGKDGGTSSGLPNAQKIASVSGGALSNLKLETLHVAKEIMDGDECPDMRWWFWNSSAQQSLLRETEVKSADYNTVKALVEGKLDTFMGFKFIRIETPILNTADGTDAFNLTTGLYDAGGTASTGNICVAVAEGGMIFANGMARKTRITERDDKSYSTQVYMKASYGAVRLEDERVLAIHCKQ